MDALDEAQSWLQARGASPDVVAEHRLGRTDLSQATRRLAMVRDPLDIHATLRGIEHVFLKGAALSAYLYGDPTRRVGKDIDVWVRDVTGAATALAGQGWSGV